MPTAFAKMRRNWPPSEPERHSGKRQRRQLRLSNWRHHTVPIVFVAVGIDPIGAGFVETMARPGGVDTN